jgi:3-(3-hydroxy-phenyl)propionate hydroxylase
LTRLLSHPTATTPRIEPIVIAARPGSSGAAKVLHDAKGRFAQRYDARDGSAYLVRPDQHVAARWRSVDAAKVRAALARAVGRNIA